MKQASEKKKKIIRISAKLLKPINGFPFSIFFSGIGQILMFHRVIPYKNKPRIWSNQYLEVTPEFLIDIIKYYKKLNYAFISIDELYFIVNSGKKHKKKFIIFTFDDGYKDNLTYAFPILKKYNIPFTIYITTDFPDKKAKLWWYALEKKILDNDKIIFSFENQEYKFISRNINEKNQVFEEIHNIIQTTPENKLNDLFQKIFTPDELQQPLELTLSWDDIKYLSQNNFVTIGAHTVSHKMLSKLSDNESYYEISESIKKIEKKINKKVKHFAFPYGGKNSFSDREIQFLKHLKIKTSTTTISKNISQKEIKNLLTLPRIACGMSMIPETFDLIRFGVIPMLRNIKL